MPRCLTPRLRPEVSRSSISSYRVSFTTPLRNNYRHATPYRPYFHEVCCVLALHALHGLSHPGVRTLRRLLSQRFIWKGLASQSNSWTRKCLNCQRNKVHRHTKAEIVSIPVPSRRFSHIHVDIVGPLPVSKGYTHLSPLSTALPGDRKPPPSTPHPPPTMRGRAFLILDFSFRRPWNY